MMWYVQYFTYILTSSFKHEQIPLQWRLTPGFQFLIQLIPLPTPQVLGFSFILQIFFDIDSFDYYSMCPQKLRTKSRAHKYKAFSACQVPLEYTGGLYHVEGFSNMLIAGNQHNRPWPKRRHVLSFFPPPSYRFNLSIAGYLLMVDFFS